jgi:hemerythrin
MSTADDKIEWNEEFKTGIEIIDKQHQTLMRIYNKQLDYRDSFKGFDALKKTIDRIVKFSAIHFKTEEALLRKHDYPDLDYHLHEHKNLKETIDKFAAEIRKGNSYLAAEFLEFLKDWIQYHIKYEDIKFSGFLASCGEE